MREEVLELMEAARESPEQAGTPQDFHFKALQVGSTTDYAIATHVQWMVPPYRITEWQPCAETCIVVGGLME